MKNTTTFEEKTTFLYNVLFDTVLYVCTEPPMYMVAFLVEIPVRKKPENDKDFWKIVFKLPLFQNIKNIIWSLFPGLSNN